MTTKKCYGIDFLKGETEDYVIIVDMKDREHPLFFIERLEFEELIEDYLRLTGVKE